MTRREPRPVSRTHERAILEQDNGELAEDVVATRDLDRIARRPGRRDDEVDEQGKQSFPASDPPSSWAEEPPQDKGGGRVVGRSEVVHPSERAAPDDPVPKTLPREGT